MPTNTGDDNKPKRKAAKKATTTKAKPAAPRKGKGKDATIKYVGIDPASIWTPFAGARGFDPTGNQTVASAIDLAAAYEDTVFACVGIISHAVAREAGKFKLVATTGSDDPRPKSAVKSFTAAETKRIEEAYPKYTRRAIRLDEVVGHGLLDLLDSPNQLQSLEKLLELTGVYLELIGSAFWYVGGPVVGGRKVPTELWLLPSHLITIDVDPKSGELAGYKFRSGEVEEYYAPADVIHFKYNPDPLNPYTGFGISPVRAVWQRVQLLRHEQSSWEAILNNMAFPSLVGSPPDGETYTPTQAQRLERQLGEKFRYGNQGGVFVVQDGAKFTPLNVPPKDLSALTMYDSIKASVARAYGVPLPILDLQDGTAEASEVAQRNFQRYCLAPRVQSILDTLSLHLAPPRTFLASSSIVQPDKVYELQRTTALVGGNVITINEGRVREGYDPKPGLDKLLCELTNTGTASAQTFQTSFTGGRRKAVTKAYKSTHPDPRPMAEALGKVFAKLAAEVQGKLVGKDITAARYKSFIPIQNWTQELADVLTPVMRAYLDEGLNAVLAEVGGSPDIHRHAVQELDQAVGGAVLALAKSTLETTDQTVEEAVNNTREAIRQGLDAGEANLQLADRLKDIFTDLSDRRVMLIAETESTRAKHAGELIAIEAAGVEARKRWLPDSMACDQCRHLAAKGAIGLDAAFEVKGAGPYSRVDHPPAHPGCRCTLQYDLDG